MHSPDKLKKATIAFLNHSNFPNKQGEATKFSFEIAMRLGKFVANNNSNLIFHSRRHRDIQDIASKLNMRSCMDGEFMVDALIYERNKKSHIKPILACESEMHPDHTVKCNMIDKEGYRGYIFDLWKLLHFRAPVLLFMACVRGESRIEKLQDSVKKLAEDYQKTWQESILLVVILPHKEKHRGLTKIAVSKSHKLSFEHVFNKTD